MCGSLHIARSSPVADDAVLVRVGLLAVVAYEGMQAAQTSGVPTLPAAPSLWRSAGFPSGVSRLFSEAHKHRAATVKGVFVSALFLYSPRAVPLQLNKQRTVANAVAKFRQQSSEGGPSGEMRIRELE